MPHDVPIVDEETTARLVARLLAGGRSAQVRAERLLAQAGSLRALRTAIPSTPDLSTPERLRLLAALELGRRSLTERRRGQVLAEPRAVVARFRELALSEVEVLVAVGLDSGRRVLVEARLVGGVDGVFARPRDLLRPVLAAGGVGLLAVHNHPSGCPAPSPEDIAFTHRLQEAARICGLALVDHIIVASGGWCSLRQSGYLGALSD